MQDIRVRAAEDADAVQIADLFCRNFGREVIQFLIYGCKGAADYIKMQIASSGYNYNPASSYCVSHTGSQVIGAVELRRSPGRLFLNHIGVHPGHQGKGIGNQLLDVGIKLSGVLDGKISLDVFADNPRALEWYGRLGFQIQQTREFLEILEPITVPGGAVYVSGLPQADVCQDRFGFSTFDVITSQSTYSVGRLGDSWFRLNDSAGLADAEVFKALRLLDPARRIFAITPCFSVTPAQVQPLLRKTHRMAAEISQVLVALYGDHQAR